MEPDHHAYIAAVVQALARSHIHGEPWTGTAVPRAATVTIDQRHTEDAYDDSTLVAYWTEEHGWRVGVRCATGRFAATAQLAYGALPLPDTVADSLRDVIRGFPNRQDGARYFRRAGDDEEAFAAELDAYRNPPPPPEAPAGPPGTDPRIDHLEQLLDSLLDIYTRAASGGPLPTPDDARQTADEIRAALADIHTMREQLRRDRTLRARYAWADGHRAGRRAAHRRRN
ncbi:hypothetical protein GTW71_07835 [Streptomyces sp. SID6041]|nr:hypothetical protein [Streptomyces sp. SID6041]